MLTVQAITRHGQNIKAPIKADAFPDGTLNLKLSSISNDIRKLNIIWHQPNPNELFTLVCIKRFYDQYCNNITLDIHYLLNARTDRVKGENDVFTLKYFCEIINNLNFSQITILDPHSDVAPALLNNVRVKNADDYINCAISAIEDTDSLVLFFPDVGAEKRYNHFYVPATMGIKHRDWQTGKIISYEIVNSEKVKNKNILIIDDICSFGGTFVSAVKELKAAGAKDIYLYITHAEKNIINSPIYTNDELVKHIFTTNSIFDKNLDIKNKISVMEV